MSTLGIVEAIIFLLHKYYKGLVVETEIVFAEIHFTLFFVVIINAVMSSLLYFLTSRVAKTQWFRMETIDIDHYVAVRKEFESVKEKLKRLKADQISEKMRTRSDRSLKFDMRATEPEGPLTTKKENWFTKLWGNYVTKNILERKHRELLVQVRFHEMRVHFIESHNLPSNFRYVLSSFSIIDWHLS